MRALEFTPSAIDDLENILTWTVGEFGTQQAASYRDELLGKCYAVADGTLHTRDCSMLMGNSKRSFMRYAQAGQHFVVVTMNEDTCLVLGFLHQSSNLPTHLRNLAVRQGKD